MTDLASRLRAIVRQPVASRSGPSDVDARRQGRELTYVPDAPGAALSPADAAAALGGTRYDAPGSSCVAVDRVWDADAWHGRQRIEACAIDAGAPLALLDPRLAHQAGCASRVVFFDIETTGLSGGAGTLPLLAACGWFDTGRFVVRQFFLSGPAGERALLDGLAELLDSATLLVTYNGRTFDVPVMETRWAYHRRDNPLHDLPHVDMLPVARRLWGRGAGSTSCTLTALERGVLRFHRIDDVPGLEIPSRYFQFLRTGDARVVDGVLEHNRYDVLSLAAVMARALRLAAEGPEACEMPCEQLGLGHLYEQATRCELAERAYGLAAASEDAAIARQALGRLAILLRRQGRHREAAEAWQGVLALSSPHEPDGPLERRALEALAIHHEHRARDLVAARAYAETLGRQAHGQREQEAERRISRLDRKLRRRAQGEPLIGDL